MMIKARCRVVARSKMVKVCHEVGWLHIWKFIERGVPNKQKGR